jgi:hypothetical protein
VARPHYLPAGSTGFSEAAAAAARAVAAARAAVKKETAGTWPVTRFSHEIPAYA